MPDYSEEHRIWNQSNPGSEFAQILAVEPGANPIILLVLFPDLQDNSHPPLPPYYLLIH